VEDCLLQGVLHDHSENTFEKTSYTTMELEQAFVSTWTDLVHPTHQLAATSQIMSMVHGHVQVCTQQQVPAGEQVAGVREHPVKQTHACCCSRPTPPCTHAAPGPVSMCGQMPWSGSPFRRNREHPQYQHHTAIEAATKGQSTRVNADVWLAAQCMGRRQEGDRVPNSCDKPASASLATT
jgi:hypothetical protein